MTSERWQQIEHLLDEVLARPDEERTAFLVEACADDAALRHEVEALLAAEAAAPDFLDADAAAFAGPALKDFPETAVVGRRVGPYRLLREVGHGGMGVVYLAEREEVGRQVALKLVRGGLADPGATERFLFEQRVLARLEHPHIARLYDVGVTADRTPYFAMEYVEGQPLDAYCDAHHLGIEARLQLFEAVGQAVQHAHQHFVVHRDLKPSNILVTEDEAGCPQVKLLDFGIAKVLADTEEGLPAQTLTAAGRRLLTPAYAAPEQIKGEAVTATTDVYSLGVVLYELLTGQRPYEATGPEATQVALTHEPKRPSTAVTGDDASTTTETAEARGTTAEGLSRRLRGDLDVICLKALQKEPERRYASAEAFIEDIKRHLAGLPVTARPDTASYRLKKFVRRHRIGVAMAVMFVVLVSGFAVAMMVQQQATARQRDLAQLEAEKASEVTRFLLGLFEANEPDTAPTDTITARTLLARGVAQIHEMGQQPEVRAEMLRVLGGVYLTLGRLDQAEPLLREALAVRRATLGNQHPDVAHDLQSLANLLIEQGNYSAADSILRTATTIVQATPEPDLETLYAIQHQQAVLHEVLGNFAAAESLYLAFIPAQQTLLGRFHEEVASALNDFGVLQRQQGKLAAAESLYKEVLDIERHLFGPKYAGSLSTMNNLAVVLEQRNELAAAESLYLDMLRLDSVLYTAEASPRNVTAQYNLAVLYHKQERYAASDSLFQVVIASYKKMLGEEHPQAAHGVGVYAYLLLQRGAYEPAEAYFRQALGVLRAYPEHPNTAFAHKGLGQLLIEQGRPAEAEPLLQKAVAIYAAILGTEHVRTADAQMWLGLCLTARGRYGQAEAALLPSLATFQAQGEDTGTQRALHAVIDLYDAWDQPAKAAEYRALLQEEG